MAQQACKKIYFDDAEIETAMDTFALLRSLPSLIKQQVMESMSCKTYEQNSILQTHGADVFFLVSGTALAVNTSQAQQGVIFENLVSGDMFGELSAIDENPCPNEVITTSTCRICRISSALFMALVMTNEFSTREILRWLSEKVRNAYGRIENMCLLTAEQRVCHELVRRAMSDPADQSRIRVFPVPTQQEIANTVGTTRQTVARVFGKLIRDQVIERRGQVLVFLDPARLKQAAEPQKAN
jgi:CRP/FNR family transcriptional regulator, cyclic AMP receptor protein